MWLQEKSDWRGNLVYFIYWINKINKKMKYLFGWQGVVNLAMSSCFDLVGPCYRVTLSLWLTIQLLGDLCLAYLWVSDFKQWPQKMLLVKKNMIGWKIDFFLNLRIFWGFWIDYARSLCAEAMIFSVWHWPLLGQHSVAVIFFYSVDVCGSVFCVFQ